MALEMHRSMGVASCPGDAVNGCENGVLYVELAHTVSYHWLCPPKMFSMGILSIVRPQNSKLSKEARKRVPASAACFQVLLTQKAHS